MAGFKVTLYGRIWVTPEVAPRTSGKNGRTPPSTLRLLRPFRRTVLDLHPRASDRRGSQSGVAGFRPRPASTLGEIPENLPGSAH
jgi:hypothetical protein